MKYKRLRAKSWNEERYGAPPDHIYLSRHLCDVHAAAIRVLDATGDDQLAALGLNPNDYRERLRRCVLLAAALHDLGKANDHFQGMIYYDRNVQMNPQGLRHEWVTLLMLNQLRDWLGPALGEHPEDFVYVEWAIAGHHPAYHHPSPPRTCPAGAGATFNLLLGEAEICTALDFLAAEFGLPSPVPNCANVPRNLVGENNVFLEIVRFSRDAQRRYDQLSKPGRRFVAAIKNCLIAADVAGSTIPKVNKDWDWITESFAHRPKPGDLQTVVDERAKTFTSASEDRQHFQNAVASSVNQVTYVKGGCGSGKTQAAYMCLAPLNICKRRN